MSKVQIFNSHDGYNLLVDYYASKEKYWDSFEKGRVLPLLGEVKDKKILDVGAGNGRLALRLAKLGAEVTALDVSEKMIERLKDLKIKRLTTVIGDCEDLLFAEESFDMVIATFLIVHLKDLKKFFDEAYRVLKPNGLFLITNINQRQAPVIKTKKGSIEIESYYHRPEKVIEELEMLAFKIEKNNFIYENDIWVNQVVLCSK
jgi:ubiquinone/menaquinone biosynthesis C-methylase UbiE